MCMEPDASQWAFDHLAIVVKAVEKGRSTLSQALGVKEWTQVIDDPVNGVRLQFGRCPSGMVYELLEPIDHSSPVHAALTSRKALLNHIAYRVDDLDRGAERLYAAGCSPAGAPKPAVAYGGALIQFFVTPERFIVELIEAPSHAHLFEIARAASSGAHS